jgi:hypothetical protein
LNFFLITCRDSNLLPFFHEEDYMDYQWRDKRSKAFLIWSWDRIPPLRRKKIYLWIEFSKNWELASKIHQLKIHF